MMTSSLVAAVKYTLSTFSPVDPLW